MSIDKKGPDFVAHEPLFRLPKAILGGTEAMRAGDVCQEFLPKGPAETDADYKYRLSLGVVPDGYERVLNYSTGQIFKVQPKVEGQDQEILDFTENVDKQGANLSEFGQNVFRMGLHAGMSFILVDHNSVLARDDESGPQYYDEKTDSWKPRTMADAKANGWGPYWVMIHGDDVIDAWFESVNGAMVLTHFRFFENVDADGSDDWTKEKVLQIRALWPGRWQTFRKSEAKDGKGGWELHAEGTTTMAEIPIAPFIPGEPIGKFCAKPALKVLADLCGKQWRAEIGHEVMMDFARRGLMFGAGLDHNDGYVIPASPGAGIHTTNTDAKLEAISLIPEPMVPNSLMDIEKITSKIASFGMQLMAPRSGSMTASQIRRESSETDSTLQRWAELFQNTLENAFRFTAMWLNKEFVSKLDIGPAVTVNTDFDEYIDDTEVNALFTSLDKRVLSRQTVYETMKRKSVIKSDREWDEESGMIENDQRSAPVLPGVQVRASDFLGQKQEDAPTTA